MHFPGEHGMHSLGPHFNLYNFPVGFPPTKKNKWSTVLNQFAIWFFEANFWHHGKGTAQRHKQNVRTPESVKWFEAHNGMVLFAIFLKSNSDLPKSCWPQFCTSTTQTIQKDWTEKMVWTYLSCSPKSCCLWGPGRVLHTRSWACFGWSQMGWWHWGHPVVLSYT